MSPLRATLTCLRRFARFGGRAARAEYWWFVPACLLALLGAAALDMVLFPADPDRGLPDRRPLSVFVSFVLTLPALAAGWRRLHDVGRSGWWLLLPGAALLACLMPAVAIRGMAAQATGGSALDVILLGAPLVSLLSCIWLIVQLARPGEPHENRFGPVPEA
ncbi:hypothetical protein NHU_04390 (plasmid) [Rhodovulum sulfidophilum]|uniref:DUF805 domain-containing protein n=1 Tax=Rhodovulum sulfidophilum TaxID=35806 RepID=A0A0D6B8R7_RHOSU|nr:hypothetical protein NHU_04390 [Rhodovulum sulfidophilum]